MARPLRLRHRHRRSAKPTVHLLSPLSPTPVRTLKIRPRKPACPACGHPDSAAPSPADRWAAFVADGEGVWPGWEDPLCARPGVGQRAGAADEVEVKAARVSPRTLSELLASRDGRGKVRVIDTRPAVEFGIARIAGSESECLFLIWSGAGAAISGPRSRGWARRHCGAAGRRGAGALIYRGAPDGVFLARSVRTRYLAGDKCFLSYLISG